MRYVIIAALSASAAVAMISVACAQNDQKASRQPRSAPTASDKPSDATVGNNPGITVQQENAVPYTACREAQGWVNGRLKCDNRY